MYTYLRVTTVKESLKSIHVWQSYARNKNGTVFNSQCTCSKYCCCSHSMTSYDGDNVLMTSPTCQQLGIHHVTMTHHQQERSTVTASRSSTRLSTTNNDNQLGLTVSTRPRPTAAVSPASASACNCINLQYRYVIQVTSCCNLSASSAASPAFRPWICDVVCYMVLEPRAAA